MEKLLNPAQAAEILSLSKSTLAKMRLSGRSPKYIKLGRRVAYRQSDLQDWIETQSFNSTAEYEAKRAF
ncbi:helix-turn-helix transcriptional regulator [Oricola indica]|uniref:helix-turn-helix transcriptional regulator n=1 Tax=Oricola indica TaxID=2872591 RepID=UPI003CCBC198